jgi:serine protease Do
VIAICIFAAAVAPTLAQPPSSLDELRATQECFREVARTVRPCLVRIDTVGGAQAFSPPDVTPIPDPREPDPDAPDPHAPDPREPDRPSPRPFQDAPGSDFVLADGPTTGLIYSPDGFIVTSSFNFVREPLAITVTLADGRRLPADLVARDHVRKIALLKVAAEGLPTPMWTDPTDIRVGQWAIALGMGLGEEQPAVSVGIVSALGRMRGNAVQTDARLSPVNYGGPLCDLSGRVMAVCTPMAQRPGELAGIELYDSGVGFAVPKDRLDEIVPVLMRGESFHRGWLGVQIDTQATDGVVVGRVADPSPIRDAGIVPGDRIVEADGRAVRHFGHLVQAIYMIPAGQTVTLRIRRDGTSAENEGGAPDAGDPRREQGGGEAPGTGVLELTVTVPLARADDLGPLPEEVPFDPSEPTPPTPNPEGPVPPEPSR